MEKTKLFKYYSHYLPLFVEVNEKDYELNNIIIFNDNGVVLKIGRGYFEDEQEKEIYGKVVKKNKIDYLSKDNFIVKSPKETFNYEKLYDLYIKEENINLKYLGEEQYMFGLIYKTYLINGGKERIFEKDIRGKLQGIRSKAENLIKEMTKEYEYNGVGIEEDTFEKQIEELRTLNKQILKEVQKIKDYKCEKGNI